MKTLSENFTFMAMLSQFNSDIQVIADCKLSFYTLDCAHPAYFYCILIV